MVLPFSWYKIVCIQVFEKAQIFLLRLFFEIIIKFKRKCSNRKKKVLQILFSMSKKSCPFLYSECTQKIGQGFVDMQYSYIRLDVPLVWGSASDPP